MKRTTSIVIAFALAVGCSKSSQSGSTLPEGMPDNELKASDGTQINQAGPDQAASKPALLAGEDLAKKYQDCMVLLNSGKFDEFKTSCVAANYVGHMGDNAMMEINGADALVKHLSSLKPAFPDWRMEPQLIMVSGRSILAVNLSMATHEGTLAMPGMPEIKATKKKIGTLFFHKLTFDDQNRASEEWSFQDSKTFLGQLGQLPKQAGPVRPALTKGWANAPIVLVSRDEPSETANIELLNKGLAAVNAHKAADAAAFWAENGLESDQAEAADVKGKKNVQKGLQMYMTAFPDLKIENKTVHAAGDYVVTIGTFTGTHTGALGKMKPTNKPVTSSFAEIFKIKDNKIVELWRFRDGMSMAMQLGLVPQPAAPAEPKPKK